MKCFCLRFSYIINKLSELDSIDRGVPYILENLVDSGVGMFEVGRQELCLPIQLAFEIVRRLGTHTFC
jgi:hypothetical protein